MTDMVKSVGEGMKDVGKAMSVDVAKGVGQVAKDVVVGSVETLTGTTTQATQQVSGQQETPGGAPSDPAAFEQWKERKEQAARARLSQLESELEAVRQKKQQEKKQSIQIEEQQKEGEVKQEEESERQKRKAMLITQANRRGGTGEVKSGKF